MQIAIKKYSSPIERLITAEWFRLLAVSQGVGELNDDLLACPRDEARYCNFDTLKSEQPHGGVGKIKWYLSRPWGKMNTTRPHEK